MFLPTEDRLLRTTDGSNLNWFANHFLEYFKALSYFPICIRSHHLINGLPINKLNDVFIILNQSYTHLQIIEHTFLIFREDFDEIIAHILTEFAIVTNNCISFGLNIGRIFFRLDSGKNFFNKCLGHDLFAAWLCMAPHVKLVNSLICKFLLKLLAILDIIALETDIWDDWNVFFVSVDDVGKHFLSISQNGLFCACYRLDQLYAFIQ